MEAHTNIHPRACEGLHPIGRLFTTHLQCRKVYSNTLSPVHMRFQTTVAAIYMTAVSLNTGSKDPVFSTTNPTADTPKIPAKDPNVLASPNKRPAYLGAISDMFATKPAWPAQNIAIQSQLNPAIVVNVNSRPDLGCKLIAWPWLFACGCSHAHSCFVPQREATRMLDPV